MIYFTLREGLDALESEGITMPPELQMEEHQRQQRAIRDQERQTCLIGEKGGGKGAGR